MSPPRIDERRPWRGVAGGVTAFGLGRSRNQPPAIVIARAQRHLWRRRFRTLSDALTHCWACGHEYWGLQKAHIHPVRFGGCDAAWNLLLLCYVCHVEQKDEASRADQLRWLREHGDILEAWMKKAGGA